MFIHLGVCSRYFGTSMGEGPEYLLHLGDGLAGLEEILHNPHIGSAYTFPRDFTFFHFVTCRIGLAIALDRKSIQR